MLIPPFCAPKGKTVLLELAILRLLSRHISPTGQFANKPGHLKAVYLAPTRALVQASGGGGEACCMHEEDRL